VKQQRAVVLEAFKALYTISTPGEIVDLPFKWRRHDYNSDKEPGPFVPRA
jgi:D-proline reductase (dithiol) PrdB